MQFVLAMKAIGLVITLTDLLVKARAAAVAAKEIAQQSAELTPEQSAQLDEEAAKIFDSPASELSGR